MIGGAADEFGVAIEGLSERLFQLEFTCDGLGWFLDEGHRDSPFGVLAGLISELLLTADKTPGTEFVPLGGSDPTNLLGGSTSQNVGSLPPNLRVLSAVFRYGLRFVSRSMVSGSVGR